MNAEAPREDQMPNPPAASVQGCAKNPRSFTESSDLHFYYAKEKHARAMRCAMAKEMCAQHRWVYAEDSVAAEPGDIHAVNNVCLVVMTECACYRKRHSDSGPCRCLNRE